MHICKLAVIARAVIARAVIARAVFARAVIARAVIARAVIARAVFARAVIARAVIARAVVARAVVASAVLTRLSMWAMPQGLPKMVATCRCVGIHTVFGSPSGDKGQGPKSRNPQPFFFSSRGTLVTRPVWLPPVTVSCVFYYDLLTAHMLFTVTH